VIKALLRSLGLPLLPLFSPSSSSGRSFFVEATHFVKSALFLPVDSGRGSRVRVIDLSPSSPLAPPPGCPGKISFSEGPAALLPLVFRYVTSKEGAVGMEGKRKGAGREEMERKGEQ